MDEPRDKQRPTAGIAENRRVEDRVQVAGEVHGEIMVFQPMILRDIGRGGAELETTFPLHPDSLHDLRITLADRSVVVKGRIAYCSISDVDQEMVTYRSGVEFVEPSEHAAAAIADFVESLGEGARHDS